jgi:hypothetical protein
MSLNAAIEKGYLPEVEALISAVGRFVTIWKTATTIEEQYLIEAEGLSTFQRLLEFTTNLRDLKSGEYPEAIEMFRVYGDYERLMDINIAKLQALTKLFLSYFNSQSISLMDLTGQMKRIRQKQSALSVWNSGEAKYVIADHFLNFDSIDVDFISVPECDVDSFQGILTLPVRNRQPLAISKVKIGSESNGTLGNADRAVTTNNLKPSFVANNDPNNWLEYERLDTGPCLLTLVVEFSQQQIVNNLVIEPVNLGNSLSFEIEDIVYSTSGTGGTSIFDLVSAEFDKEFFTIKSVGADLAWNVTHLPIKAKTISIKFRQSQAYQIETETYDSRIVNRDRYAIAIKEIKPHKIEFEKEGGINSKNLDLPGGLYAAVPFADIWPPTGELFDENLEVSFDGGVTWSQTGLPLEDVNTVLMNGTETSILWRIKLSRLDDVFATLTSFVEEPTEVLTPKVLLRTVSRFQSPSSIPLTEKPAKDHVYVIQPQIARRGDRYSGIRLGQASTGAMRIPVPLSVVKDGLDPDEAKILINGIEYNYQKDNLAVAANEWGFSDDFRQVIFAAGLPAAAEIKMVFDEELMYLEEREDGYYHQMTMLFDPDKENIDIKYLPRTPVSAIQILNRDKTVIDLNASNIADSSWSLVSENGVTYTEVATKAEVYDAVDQDYFIDYVNGVLYLADTLGDDVVKVTFRHFTEIQVAKPKVDVIVVDNVPWGVRISKEDFQAAEKIELVSSSPSKVVNIRTGVHEAKIDVFSSSNRAKQLSHDCIIEGTVSVDADFLGTASKPIEVEYIDGQTEFLGLIPMTIETTTPAESGTDTYVQFALSARGLWHQPLGVLFSDAGTFSNLVASVSAAKTGSVGDYFVALDGTVTVNIGIGAILNGGRGITYYYRDPSFDPDAKFSLDYRRGVIYTYNDMTPTASIRYKAACYKIAYDIAEEVSDYTYDAAINSVSVRTEGLQAVNSLVKVIWTEAPQNSELEELKKFFSPIISVLAFRFQ